MVSCALANLRILLGNFFCPFKVSENHFQILIFQVFCTQETFMHCGTRVTLILVAYSSLNHRRNPRPQKVKSYGVIEALSWSIPLIFVIVALSILDLTLMLCPFMGVKIPLNSSSISVHLLTSHQYFTSSQTTKRKILFIVFFQLFKEREKKKILEESSMPNVTSRSFRSPPFCSVFPNCSSGKDGNFLE